MAPANKAWRPTKAKQINTRRGEMTAFRDRLIRFYVAGAENERKMFEKLVEYCIAMNINKTAYDRGIDHPTTGPLAKIIQNKSVPVTAIFAYAIQQNTSEATLQASSNPLMNLATERVSKLIGENGNECFIPEDHQEIAAEAHDITTKVMATDAHFRYYGKEFVVHVAAIIKKVPRVIDIIAHPSMREILPRRACHGFPRNIV
jgi:hypothetical protein